MDNMIQYKGKQKESVKGLSTAVGRNGNMTYTYTIHTTIRKSTYYNIESGI